MSDVRFEVIDRPAEPEWDRFVERTEGGHLTQTVGWAEFKAATGWNVVHVSLTSGSRLIAGAHLLWRRLGALGAVGYLPRGPLVAPEAAHLAERIEQRIESEADRRNVRVLAVQPPPGAWAVGERLRRAGWQEGLGEINLPGTVRLDVRAEDDQLLAAMRSSTRANVRRGGRETRVRLAGRGSLPEFATLLEATAERQSFEPEPVGYLEQLWEHVSRSADLVLVMADVGGEPVSGILVAGAGTTAYYKRGGWSGRHRRSRANEAVHWAAIRWARDSGFECYDFEGIDIRGARAAAAGDPIPEDLRQSVTRFKLGFGGTPVVDPVTMVRVRPALVGAAIGAARRSATLAPVVERAVRRVRLS